MTTSPAARVRSAIARTATTVPAETTSGTADGVTSPTNPNAGLGAQDQANLAAAIRMERALQHLYGVAVADHPGVAIIQRSHEAFATRLAGIAGIASSERDEDLIGQHEAAFGSDPAAAGVAAEAEAVGRYLEWVVDSEDERIVAAMSAIAVSEARFGGLLGGDSALDKMSADGSSSATTETTEEAQ